MNNRRSRPSKPAPAISGGAMMQVEPVSVCRQRGTPVGYMTISLDGAELTQQRTNQQVKSLCHIIL